MPKIVDANIILRYLVGDSPLQAGRIKKLISENKEKLILTDLTVAEIIWVLGSYYQQERKEIAEKIFSLLETPIFIVNKSLLTRAVHYFQEYNLDYIDAYLIAYGQENNISQVLSYDQSIDKVKEIKRIEP